MIMLPLRRYFLRKGLSITSKPEHHRTVQGSNPVKYLQIPEPQLNWSYLCDPQNTSYLKSNSSKRKRSVNIENVLKLYQQLETCPLENDKHKIWQELLLEGLKIPNDTHPEPFDYGSEPKEVKRIGQLPMFSFKPKDFGVLAEKLHVLHNKRLTPFCGNKSYYLLDGLSQLEHGLVRFAIDNLLKRGFQLISVPDILHQEIIESCGMDTKGQRNQVYRLDPDWHGPKAAEGELCLSGTAEMALGGYFMNRLLKRRELPLKVVSVSRCYRAEVGINAHEKGIYRVHYFTKVEMFGVTTEERSNSLLEEFVSIQEEIFSSLGLHLRTLDMPPCELGSPAYRKFDVEAWMPGHGMFGELSSSSNCTDYQSRRLNIRCDTGEEKGTEFVHTVNGTACAIPRLVVALFETFQQANGSVLIPEPLQPYMKGKKAFDQKSILKSLMNQTQLGELEKRAKQRVRMKSERGLINQSS